MKKIIFIIAILLIQSGFLFSQSNNVKFANSIISAFNSSNTETIANNAQDRFVLKIFSEGARVNKAQAKVILKEFFKENKVSNYKPEIHELSGGITIIDGKVRSGNKNIRIQITQEKDNKRVIITEIIISNE